MRAEESRVLVVAPVGQDAEAMAALLRDAGVMAEVCAGAGECLSGVEAGAGVVLLTEEALELPGTEDLLESFKRQPAWSALPLIVLTSGGESRSARLLEIAAELAWGMTLLERPMSARTLLHSVQVALRSRQRQYQVRDLMAALREALADAEKRAKVLDAIFEHIPVGLTLAAAPDVRILRVSRHGLELTGKPAQVIEGIPAHEHTQKWDIYEADGVNLARNEDLPLTRATQKGEVVRNEVKVLGRPDGTRIPILCNAGPIRDADGLITGGLIVWRDISELKKAEEALREREEQFRMLADSIPTLAWWATGDGYITWYNRRWYDYTGTTPEKMEGWGWQSVHDPEMLPLVLERWKLSIATSQPFEMEFPLRGADGRFGWFLTRVIPVKDKRGRVLRWFGTNTDVSEIREAREVLKRSKEQLEQLVGERTAELRELVGELEHFSYSITHDMRAPLRAMMGFAEVVKELHTGSEHKEQKIFLERIQTAAKRMDLLITDALNYSRAVRGELPLGPMDVSRLLRGMVDTYPELQLAQGSIRIQPELPLVMGNEAGLTQCFSNLLVNAVKFARPGEAPEIHVWGEVLNSPLSTPNAQPEHWVRLWVEDRGIGIGPSMLPRVFDMFSRGASQQAGTGIGLALVRKVVQRMGGRVGVESEEGHGSRFWVELRSGDLRRTTRARGIA